MKRPAKFQTQLEIGSDRWREQVAAKLLDGYGIEDIGHWLNCHYGYISAEVQRLRLSGKLAQWWPAP